MEAFGRSSGVIWGDLGTFLDIFGYFWTVFEATWGRSWAVLAHLVASWGDLGTSGGVSLGRLGSDLEDDLGPSWRISGSLGPILGFLWDDLGTS